MTGGGRPAGRGIGALLAWTAAGLAAALLALALAAATASAIAPDNDDFGDAELLAGDAPEATGSTDGATAEAGEPNRLGDMAGHSVWFRWTPDRSGLILVSCTSAFDAIVAVYTGSSLTGLTEVGSDHSGFECDSPELLFRAHAGTEYRIAVDARLGGGAGGSRLRSTTSPNGRRTTISGRRRRSPAAPTFAEIPPGQGASPASHGTAASRMARPSGSAGPRRALPR